MTRINFLRIAFVSFMFCISACSETGSAADVGIDYGFLDLNFSTDTEEPSEVTGKDALEVADDQKAPDLDGQDQVSPDLETPDLDDSDQPGPDQETDDTQQELDGQDLQSPDVEPGCVPGECCDNGVWVPEGDPCLSGQDEFDCTQDTCGNDHVCQHAVLPNACLIESACYEEYDSHPTQQCLWCDPETSPSEWSPKPNGEFCDDGNLCSYGEICDGEGSCAPGTPVTCTSATDVCGAKRSCNGTATCAEHFAASGTSCESDGNVCTEDLCTGSGACAHKAVAPGTSCDDGNPATLDDECQGTVCGGTDPCAGVVCVALDQCHNAGVCNPDTGVCSNPAKANGQACNDSNGCTQTDTCQSGICTGSNPVTCTPMDQCHDAGVCSPATGVCSNPAKANGQACNDGNACTKSDTCQSGICTGSNPVTCTPMDQCHNAGVCNPDTGVCSNPAKANGQACNDSNGCTQTDTCQSGICTGSNPVTCTPMDQCHSAGVCDASSGVCSNPTAQDGTWCNDGDVSTSGDVCLSGLCSGTAAPVVTATFPADATSPVAGTLLSVTFSMEMMPGTLVAQTSPGACAGSIQVSLDDFATCIAFATAAPSMSDGNTVATLLAAPGLLVNRTYKFRVTTAAQSALFVPLAGSYTSANGFTTQSPNLCDGSVVISQLYGGAPTGVDPDADYVVLHNRGSQPVAVDGWSVQYASATGTTWNHRVPLTGTIQPGQYYLVQMSAAGLDNNLPTPDAYLATYSGSMSATAGKVALVRSLDALSGACPISNASLVDFVGYGTTANCREGTVNAPAPTATTALLRNQNGCGDVGDNSADFVAGTPTPVNTTAPAVTCGCYVMNESNLPLETDYCITQFPKSLSVAAAATLDTLYGQIWQADVTPADGGNSDVRAQVGWGLPGANPQYESWNWVNAYYNLQSSENDEYMNLQAITAPAAGSYRYVYRFSIDQGVTWTYCDNDGAGANAGLQFSLDQEAVLLVTP